MSHKLKLSLDQNAYDLENIQSSDALAYLKDPTTFHASHHLARNVNLTNLHITRVKPRTDSQNSGGGEILHSNQSQDSPNSAKRFSLVTSPAETSLKTGFRASPEKQKPINNPKDRVRFKSLEVEELSHIVESQDNFTCPICYCDYEESSIVTLPACHHKFCKECMHNYIKKQMNEFQVLRIQCPQDKCEENLPDTHLKDILDQETYEAYQAKKMLKLKNKDIYLRYCPKPGCTRPFYPDNKTQFTVCSCGTTICHGCFHQKHDGKTCLEATAGEFELFVDNEDLKACMVCKTVSEKRAGCSHVVCPVCDYEWCWNCGREWEPGHGSRCLNKWSPRAPKAFEQGKSKTCFETFLNAVFLIFEIIGFGLSSALVVIVIWPCMMSGEIEKNLLRKKIKSPGLRKALAFLMAFISWPVAIILYPINAISEEYGGSCRRRRWKKGTSANFGFGKQLADGRKKFALSGAAESQVKSQPNQESKIEGVLNREQEKMEEIDLEVLEHMKSDPHPVVFQRNRSKMNTGPLGLVSNHMIASEVDLIVQNNSPDSTRPIPNLLERRQ